MSEWQNAQALTLLKVIEKSDDQRCVDLLEFQGRGWFVQPLLTKLEELAERIAIGTDCVRADPAVAASDAA
jgi:hypothetical protein